MSPQYDDGNDKLDWTATRKIKDNEGHDNKPYAKIPTPTSAFDKTRHKTKDNDGHDNYDPVVRIATPASVSDKARRKSKESEGHDNYPDIKIITPISASDKNSTARHKTNGHDGHDNNPYCQVPTPTSAPDKRSRDKVFEVLNRCGKKVEDVTRIAGGIKDHLKFSPSIREAAMARLAQGTKMVVEGGPERVFQREFGILAAEKLIDSFTCYISTTSGPVSGMLYISNKRIAFCSDFAIRLPSSAGGTGVPAHYKVVLELGKISSISSSSNVVKPCEKYAHVVTRNGSVYWFMGFVSYNDAFNCLNKALLSFQSVL